MSDGAVEGAVSDVSATVGPGQGYLRDDVRQLLLPPPPELGRVLVTKPDTDHDDGVGPDDGEPDGRVRGGVQQQGPGLQIRPGSCGAENICLVGRKIVPCSRKIFVTPNISQLPVRMLGHAGLVRDPVPGLEEAEECQLGVAARRVGVQGVEGAAALHLVLALFSTS